MNSVEKLRKIVEQGGSCCGLHCDDGCENKCLLHEGCGWSGGLSDDAISLNRANALLAEMATPPELKGVEMWVSDDGDHWDETIVFGIYKGRYLAVEDHVVSYWNHAKLTLEETLERKFADATLKEVMEQGYTVVIGKKEESK